MLEVVTAGPEEQGSYQDVHRKVTAEATFSIIRPFN
jgi:hypothetical protein